MGWLALSCLVWMQALQVVEATEPEAAPRKKVLILFPDQPSLEGTLLLEGTLRHAVRAPGGVDIYSESLALPERGDGEGADRFWKIYNLKYGKTPFDLVMAVEEPVFEFVLQHRDRFFPNIPIIFGGLVQPSAIPRPRPPGITGSTTDLRLNSTLELMLALQPELRKVVVVAGAADRDKRVLEIAQQQLQPFEARVRVEYWEGLSPEEAKPRLQALAPESAVFVLQVSRDRAGLAYSLPQYLEQIVSYSPVPIYNYLSSEIGQGILAGYVFDSEDDTRKMAELANQVLSGTRPDDLPLLESPMVAKVDWKELQRWGLPEARLPAGTILKFREPTLWQKYWADILGLVAFMAGETLLLLLLLLEIQRKNRARAMLQRRFVLEQLAAEYSEKLSHCPPHQVEEEIQKGVNAVRVAKELDWAVWFLMEEGIQKPCDVIETSREGMETGAVGRWCEKLPWMVAQIRKGEGGAYSKLDEMPPEAETDRRYLKQEKIESFAIATSKLHSGMRGALVLMSQERGMEWSSALMGRLGMMANLFGNAFARMRVERALEEKQEWLQMALEASLTVLCELDVATGRVRWSQAGMSLLGDGPAELEIPWQKFLELLPEGDRADLYEHVKEELEKRHGKDVIVREWRYHEPGGAERWLLFRGRVDRDEDGNALRMRGVNVDITDLKTAKTELIHLTGRLIRAQEEERQRLARELHDDIGQRISLLIIALDKMKQELPLHLRREKEELLEVLEEANQLATDIHALSHQLHSSKLRHLGLRSALRELCAQVSRQQGVEVRLHADSANWEITDGRALCLYRVAQEALKNAVKHSGSSQIEVELSLRGSRLCLRIKDYGRGFDLNNYKAGVGLASMQERLRMEGGQVEVHSAPGEGTEVRTEVETERVALPYLLE